MVRLNVNYDSDEEFPDIDTILHLSGKIVPQTPRKQVEKEHRSRALPKSGIAQESVKEYVAQKAACDVSKSVTKVSCNEKQMRRQRPLGAVHINSLLRPRTVTSPAEVNEPEYSTKSSGLNDDRQVRSSPRRTARQPVNYKIPIPELSSASGSGEESYDDDLSDFIVNDSASESEIAASTSSKRNAERSCRYVIDDSADDMEELPLQKPKKGTQMPLKNSLLGGKPHLPFPGPLSSGRNPESEVIDLTSPAKAIHPIACPDTTPKRRYTPIDLESSIDQNQDAAPAVLQ